MKKTRLTAMIIQGGLLVAFAGGFYFFTQTQVAPTEVYTFGRDIPVNTIIAENDLVKKSIPKDAVTENMMKNKEDIIGKAVTTKVFPGEYVIKQKLIKAEDVDIFEQMDLSNYRKISIELEAGDAVGGNLKKGDRVDLIFVTEGKSEDKDFIYSKTFMQDVLVYNVIDDDGRKFIDQTEGNMALTNEEGEVVESGDLQIVTLAVTSEQAEEIEARLEAGNVRLLGRFEDSVDNATNGYTHGDYGPIKTQPTNPETR